MSEADLFEEPALVRRHLGRALRRLRLAAGKTHADAETAGMGHRSTLWRIEAGRAKVRPSTIRALCWLYGVDDTTADALYEMACRAEQGGWWEEFRGDLPAWFTLYVGLEAEAHRISTFHPGVVDGLLQTPDYARAVFAAGLPRPAPEELERQVAIRLERQRRAFDRPEPLRLCAVLCESVLRRQIGGADVLAEQITHLRRMDETDHIEVRVLRFSTGGHPAIRGRLTVLDLPSDAGPDVVYLEALNGGRYLETRAELEHYRGIFSRLRELAVPMEEYE